MVNEMFALALFMGAYGCVEPEYNDGDVYCYYVSKEKDGFVYRKKPDNVILTKKGYRYLPPFMEVKGSGVNDGNS